MRLDQFAEIILQIEREINSQINIPQIIMFDTLNVILYAKSIFKKITCFLLFIYLVFYI